MNQYQDFNMDANYSYDNWNRSTEIIEFSVIEDEEAVMEMMLAAGEEMMVKQPDPNPAIGFYDDIDVTSLDDQHVQLEMNLMKGEEMLTWPGRSPSRDYLPFIEVPSFPPYRPIEITAPSQPSVSFPPSPKGPKFSYIPEVTAPVPKLAAVMEYSGETDGGASTST